MWKPADDLPAPHLILSLPCAFPWANSCTEGMAYITNPGGGRPHHTARGRGLISRPSLKLPIGTNIPASYFEDRKTQSSPHNWIGANIAVGRDGTQIRAQDILNGTPGQIPAEEGRRDKC